MDLMAPALAPPRPLRLGALSRLRAQLDLLTPALRRVASYALAQPHALIYQTVTEVALSSRSGEASVIRLTRDLGFTGFQDFKLALAADLAGELASDSAVSGPEGHIAQAASRGQTAILETRKVLDPAALGRAVELIAAAPAVLVTGQGASGVSALDYAYKFLRLGLPAWATLDPHLAAMQAATLAPGSVAVGITRSGSTRDTVHTLRQAKGAGAVTIAVTHRARSPVTRHTDLVLHTASPEDPLGGGATATRIGQLLVLEALYSGLKHQLPNSAQAIRLTAAAVSDKSY